MPKLRKIWIVAIIVLLMASAAFYYSTRASDRLIRISSNPWVGFTPFIYAQEKGWLKKTPFRFLWLVDLSDNARLYEGNFTQGFTATQYEMLHFKDYSHIKPIFLIDRSYGADAILSNRSLEQLRNTAEPIQVYLELGSLDEDLFRAFVRENKLSKLNFLLNNSSQKEMIKINSKGSPVMVISYAPYLSALVERGFMEVASTANMQSFFVIDALFMDERALAGRKDDYQALRQIFNRAENQLRSDPHEFYQVVHGYLEGQSYEEFMQSTRQIMWLNHGDTSLMLRQLQSQHIKTGQIIP